MPNLQAFSCIMLALIINTHASAATVCASSEMAGKSQGLSEKELKNLHYRVKQKVRTFEGVKEHEFEQTPTTGLRVKGGWLVGSNRGEFGGELAFISDTGSKEILFSDNIHQIYNANNSLFVIAGLSHLLTSSGTIYKLSQTPAGIQHKALHELDAEPNTSFLSSNGDIVINTSTKTLLLSPNGSLKEISCNSIKNKTTHQ